MKKTKEPEKHTLLKDGKKKNTNISDVNCDMKEIQEVIQDGRCYHEPCEN